LGCRALHTANATWYGRFMLLLFYSLVFPRGLGAGTPVVSDATLEIRLFASEPDVVTPIGMAAADRNRLFVIESHTHQRESDYPGPQDDCVKILLDNDHDGRADESRVFADRLRYAMNLRFSPRGALYLTHRNGILVLLDRDGDGVSDAREVVLELSTHVSYIHDSVHGIAFSVDGWLYFGFGYNQGAEYTLTGTDGIRFKGSGEGGRVFRCRPDGSKLQSVAIGFWNPFALEFDRAGNLFCVDNDPDARSPCRLLHVVDQGDYGFRFEYGRDGQHPFVAWDGELPGTLPMVAGTGEAPSGIVDCETARLPAGYHGTLLVTAWGDNTIERYRPMPRGASLHADREIVVQGDASFRPVAIVAGADGAIYISDWADKAYPVHQKGRIWQLRARDGVATPKPPVRFPRSQTDPAARRLQKLLAADQADDFAQLHEAVCDPDPFITAAAVGSLAKPPFRGKLLAEQGNEAPAVRLGALLALRRSGHVDVSFLRKCLADPDEQVRLMAVIWIGEKHLASLKSELESAIRSGGVTPRLFHAYLATAQRLERGPIQFADPDDVLVRRPGTSNAALLEEILRDGAKPAALRAMAVAMIPDPDDKRFADLILNCARAPDSQLSIEAIRTLASSSNPVAVTTITVVAHDANAAADVRAEAISALANQPDEILVALVDLLDDPVVVVQEETARAVRRLAGRPRVRDRLQAKYDSLRETPAHRTLAEQLQFALYPPGVPSDVSRATNSSRPDSDTQWRTALQDGGDAMSGRRVFLQAATGCVTCHRVRGRGGSVGPDLSAIARSSDRDKLITSILSPSRDVAPGYVQSMVLTTDDAVLSGLITTRGADGSLTLTTAAAASITIPATQIAEIRPTEVSIMPEDLELGLSVKDFRDLLAFLLSLK